MYPGELHSLITERWASDFENYGPAPSFGAYPSELMAGLGAESAAMTQ
jgi:hypothetical protein